MRSDEVLIRALIAADLPVLGTFRCSDGEPFEDVVEQRIRDPLSLALIAATPEAWRFVIASDCRHSVGIKIRAPSNVGESCRLRNGRAAGATSTRTIAIAEIES